MFPRRDKSLNVPIEAVVSATVFGNCIYSSFSLNKAATTSWTASITVDLPTLNTSPMLTYELPCASLYLPRAKTFSGGIQYLNRVFSRLKKASGCQPGLERSLSSFSVGVESNLSECFCRGNVFQTMTLPDALRSTNKGGFVNDAYSSKPYVF